jgi:hypothetical protein
MEWAMLSTECKNGVVVSPVRLDTQDLPLVISNFRPYIKRFGARAESIPRFINPENNRCSPAAAVSEVPILPVFEPLRPIYYNSLSDKGNH